MKKTALAVRIVAFLLFLMLVAFQSVKLAESNPAPSEPAHIIISCPQDGATYTTQNLLLNFTCTNPLDWFGRADTNWYIGSPIFTYSLDGKENVTITGTTTLPVTSSTTLPKLSYGLHNITVYGLFTLSPHTNVTHSSRTVFSVEPSQSPTPSTSPSPTPSPSPSPTASPSPSQEPTSTPYNEPQQREQEIIVGVTFATAVFAAGLGLLIYLIRKK